MGSENMTVISWDSYSVLWVTAIWTNTSSFLPDIRRDCNFSFSSQPGMDSLSFSSQPGMYSFFFAYSSEI